MKILKYQKIGKDKYKIYLDNNTTISLYENVILQNNLLLKKEIDSNLLEQLANLNELEKIYNSCLNYISYRFRSELEINNYLIKKNINQDIITKIISKLKLNNYLNDTLFVNYYILDKINLSNDGPYKIKKHLIDHNINNDLIDDYLTKYNNTFKEKIDKLITKYLKQKNNLNGNVLKNKIYTNLVTLGYDKSMILSVIDNYNFENKSNIQKIYDSLYKKYSKKYQGYQLESIIRQKLYQKGYNLDDVNL